MKNYYFQILTKDQQSESKKEVILTKHSGNKAQRKLRCEQGEEPGSGVECWRNLMALQVIVQVAIVVV